MGLKVTPNWHETFLRHVRNGKTMREASFLSKVGMERIIQEKNIHPDFADKLIEAKDAAPRALQW